MSPKELERWLSSWVPWLLLQTGRVQFSAPTLQLITDCDTSPGESGTLIHGHCMHVAYRHTFRQTPI